MVRNAHDVVSFAPFFIHQFNFLQPHFLEDAEKFNIICADTSLLVTISDKLRYHRHRKGLFQRDVADAVGIDRTNYSAYESELRDYYPPDVLQRIATLFEIDISNLFDEYNSFLHSGQGSQLKAFRSSMNLSQREFAAYFGIIIHQAKAWEQDRVCMSKRFWEQIFK